MLEFSRIVGAMEKLPFHVMCFSMYDGSQVQTHRFVPCGRCSDSYSVAKAFVMTAIGMLYDEGKLDVHTTIRQVLDGLVPADLDPAWSLVTVEHALKHRIGFESGFLDVDTEDPTGFPTRDYLSLVLSHPLAHLPGTKWVYSDAAYYLLSRVVSRVAGCNVDRFLAERLFEPMGFKEAAWSCCPQGYPIGATGLYIATEDMLKLGILYLNGGVYEGRRYLSEEWVRMAIGREYEWSTMTAGGLIGKGGLYGQAVLFSRERGCAFAVHAHEEGDPGILIDLLDELVCAG